MVDGLRPSGCRQSAVAFSNSSAASCGATSCECTAAGVLSGEKKAGQLNKHICYDAYNAYRKHQKDRTVSYEYVSRIEFSNYLSMCLSICQPNQSIFQSIYPQYLSIFFLLRPPCGQICDGTLPACPILDPVSIYWSTSIYLSIHPSIYLSICPSRCIV